MNIKININDYIDGYSQTFAGLKEKWPWQITSSIPRLLQEWIATLDAAYTVTNGVAIHHSALVESNVIIKAPAIISEGCFIGANAYLRGGVFLGKRTVIGTSCEVKSSILFHDSAVAHFNFIGDSIIGSYVNFEAGSIIANHYNEREDKLIKVMYGSEIIDTHTKKFGALVGDHCTIGANAVLSPGTILSKSTVVKRLELVEQYTPTQK